MMITSAGIRCEPDPADAAAACPDPAMQGLGLAVLLGLVTLLVSGCGRPNQANIELRRENHSLRQQISELQRAREADRASLQALETRATTVPILPSEQLEQLFTVHGISFGRLTGGADLDPDRPGDEALKVYVVPRDRAGDPIKAAGAFIVEAFDLQREGEQRIGRWEFPVEQAGENWFGRGLLYTYVLTCPWQTVPQSRELIVQVTFVDALTQRTFVERREVQVSPPPTPGSSGSPAGVQSATDQAMQR